MTEILILAKTYKSLYLFLGLQNEKVLMYCCNIFYLKNIHFFMLYAQYIQNVEFATQTRLQMIKCFLLTY